MMIWGVIAEAALEWGFPGLLDLEKDIDIFESLCFFNN